MIRVALVCINYKTDHQSCDLIRDLYKVKYTEEIDSFVLDNSSTNQKKDCFHLLSQEFSNFNYIPCPNNLGYFGAARFFLNNIQDNIWKYDWIIISNPDIKIDDAYFFSKMCCYNDNQIGVIAPAIQSLLSGQNSNPFMKKRPSSLRMHFYKWVFSNYFSSFSYDCFALFKARILNRIKKKIKRCRSVEEIYAPHGSFMIFSKQYFYRGGNFEHGAFLYGEEITIAEKCISLGLKIIYIPELCVIHKERQSTGFIYSRRVLNWKKEANRYLANNYF